MASTFPDWSWPAFGVDTRTQADFVQWFGLSTSQAKILEALYLANGQWLPHKRLAVLANCGNGGAVKAHLHNIRDALDRDGIEERNDLIEGKSQHGNRLTAKGLAECAQALQRMKEAK